MKWSWRTCWVKKKATELLIELSYHINKDRHRKCVFFFCCRCLFMLKFTSLILKTSLSAVLLWGRKFSKVCKNCISERKNKIVAFFFRIQKRGRENGFLVFDCAVGWKTKLSLSCWLMSSSRHFFLPQSSFVSIETPTAIGKTMAWD